MINPVVSVIICTHNRASFLQQALESLSAQTLPFTQFEILVIDNASSDQTQAILARFSARLPNLRVMSERRLGLSFARNTGYLAATTPYVVYLDDDARAVPDWLAQILNAFQSISPAPAVVGGRVWPDWGGVPPAWLSQSYWTFYTWLDHGDEGRLLSESEHLVGANIAFRRDILQEIGGFATNLGRRGDLLLSGEEAAAVRRFRELGWPVYYAPQAAVWHSVPKDRQTRRWLFRRLFWDGASQPLLKLRQWSDQQNQYQPGREAYIDLRRCGRFVFDFLYYILLGRFTQAQDSLLSLIQRLGRLRTHLRLRFGWQQ